MPAPNAEPPVPNRDAEEGAPNMDADEAAPNAEEEKAGAEAPQPDWDWPKTDEPAPPNGVLADCGAAAPKRDEPEDGKRDEAPKGADDAPSGCDWAGAPNADVCWEGKADAPNAGAEVPNGEAEAKVDDWPKEPNAGCVCEEGFPKREVVVFWPPPPKGGLEVPNGVGVAPNADVAPKADDC